LREKRQLQTVIIINICKGEANILNMGKEGLNVPQKTPSSVSSQVPLTTQPPFLIASE